MHLHREKQMDASYQALARHSPNKALYWYYNFWLDLDRPGLGFKMFLLSRRIKWYATWPTWVIF